VIRYRPFRNSDPPALVELWNQSVPAQGAARPLHAHELDSHAFGAVCFDRAGLIVAEREGRILGYVHAGFGPDLPVERAAPFALDTAMGTIAMLVVDPGVADRELRSSLILKAEAHLRCKGASVIYAGGQFPLNPFYWGLYGGVEGSGVLSGHTAFAESLASMGYEPVSTTVALEFDLRNPEPRDPRAVLARRQTQLAIEDDPPARDWWENISLGEFHLTRFRLLARDGGLELAQATAWDMAWFGRADGRVLTGLCGVEVSSAHRRRGYGRYLVSEVIRWAREHGSASVLVQTAASNQPALALYQCSGFVPADHSLIYRLPAQLVDRSATAAAAAD
jgi:ribosomal protein S18 acetylase RimI-like enzyme